MKFVAVQAGARDDYQLPWALAEAGMLECFVTDAYRQPGNHRLISALLSKVDAAKIRNCPAIDGERIINDPASFAWFTLEGVANKLLKSRTLINLAHSCKDRTLSLRALRESRLSGSKLFATSYYAADAFEILRRNGEKGLLFQVHPAPREVRRLLLEEIELQPVASASLSAERELATSELELERLSNEAKFAERVLCASEFTKKTLIAQGVDIRKISVCPYGVDFSNYKLRAPRSSFNRPLRLFWLGSLVQRKGLTYLLEAVKSFPSNCLELVCCTRSLPDKRILEYYSLSNITIKVGLTDKEMIAEMKRCDVFILPSIAEGFGHALAQAMAVGLPVIATNHTMAADCVDDGVEGFVIPIRSAVAIEEKIAWGIDNRAGLDAMGIKASQKIRAYTWAKFRRGVVDFAISTESSNP
jgi:glycosyltransferase involved in cell wall biosynthesis